MRRVKKPLFKSKPVYAVVVDGECEYWYLEMLKRNERNINFHLKPEIPGKKPLQEQYDRVIKLAEDYDKVFWIIDCDVVATETALTKKGVETLAHKLDRFITVLERDYKNSVVVIRNNPCLEYWLLLHFEETAARFNNCDDAGKRLKKKLTAYQKTQSFYTKQDNDIYLQLKPRLYTAIKNALKVNALATDMDSSVTQMYLLFHEIGLATDSKNDILEAIKMGVGYKGKK